ncbi:hypothetical protein CK621_14520 [Vandammella animalimorsus]|uniref:Uncharacterized protein n=1 Tax=Vandammella animalimorsus TaxID=2029117 RepID=A0A2A2AMB5_9BURK|nr:hypothetical protein CK621_14520 [Vandammella animalimorsus]
MHTLHTLNLAAALALLLAAPVLAQDGHQPQSEPTQAEQQATAFDNWLEQASPRIAWRNDTINAIVQRMAPQLEHLPEGDAITVQLALGLHRMSDTQLQAATAYPTLLGLETAIHHSIATPAGDLDSGMGKAWLGDEVNLVFVPITPCRIADSRKATQGKLQRNVTRTYTNYGSLSQGGDSGCNNPASSVMRAGDPGALALTVTATQAEGSGHLSLGPWNHSSSTSVLNFRPGVAIANSTVVKTAGTYSSQLPDFQITASQNVHVIVDLLGFYLPNEPAALDCKTTEYGSYYGISARQCEAGYARISTLCRIVSEHSALQGTRDFFYEDSGCTYTTGMGSVTIEAASYCCRIRGRGRN